MFPRRRILARNLVFWRILRQNPSTCLGCNSQLQEHHKNENKTKKNETTKRIVTNFCRGVVVHDVITSANFTTIAYGVRVRGVKLWASNSRQTEYYPISRLSSYRHCSLHCSHVERFLVTIRPLLLLFLLYVFYYYFVFSFGHTKSLKAQEPIFRVQYQTMPPPVFWYRDEAIAVST